MLSGKNCDAFDGLVCVVSSSGKEKVKVNPSFRLTWLRQCHPWVEEAMLGAFSAKLSKER
jgi:hypothetical protein